MPKESKTFEELSFSEQSWISEQRPIFSRGLKNHDALNDEYKEVTKHLTPVSRRYLGDCSENVFFWYLTTFQESEIGNLKRILDSLKDYPFLYKYRKIVRPCLEQIISKFKTPQIDLFEKEIIEKICMLEIMRTIQKWGVPKNFSIGGVLENAKDFSKIIFVWQRRWRNKIIRFNDSDLRIKNSSKIDFTHGDLIIDLKVNTIDRSNIARQLLTYASIEKSRFNNFSHVCILHLSSGKLIKFKLTDPPKQTEEEMKEIKKGRKSALDELQNRKRLSVELEREYFPHDSRLGQKDIERLRKMEKFLKG